MKTYIPHPIDTSGIQLSEELLQLGELLARNTHENYSQLRMEAGWSYGPRRDDMLKQNPTLVPYEQLPEGEKEYDRRTANEVLKVMIALGYVITKAE